MPVPRISDDIDYEEAPCLVLSKFRPNLSPSSVHWGFCGLEEGDEAPCWLSIGHFNVCRALSLKDEDRAQLFAMVTYVLCPGNTE